MTNPVNTLHPLLKNIGSLGIVPVIVIDNPRHASPLATALIAGGLPCAEITFRTDAAREAIAVMHEEHPEVLVGAGTVLTVQQAQQAVDAGASFIVAPGLNARVVSFCKERGIPMTPGVMTPTDIEAALELGLNVLKYFPAEAAGGIRFLKAVSAPYKTVRFVPTGGIDRANFLQYLTFPPTLAVGGSWMVKAELIRGGRFDLIRGEVTTAVRDMLDIRLESPATEHPEVQGAIAHLGSIVPLADSSPVLHGNKGTAGENAADQQVLHFSTPFLDRVTARLDAAGVGYSSPAGDPKRIVLEITPVGWTLEIAQRHSDKGKD